MIIWWKKPAKQLTIAMAWWWSWGHVFPIKSLLERIDKKPQYTERVDKIYRFGSEKWLEQQICNELQLPEIDLKFVPIFSGKFRRETPRKSRLKNIRDIFLFVGWFFQSLFYLLRYGIDVIFCKGGYVALPVVLAGALLHKKVIVHESDTKPWLVNKIAHRFATKTFTWFDNVFPNAKTVGQILSDDILSWIADPKQLPLRTSILVVGGSQGSRRLYQTFLHVLQDTPDLQHIFDFHMVLWLLNQEMST